MSSTRFTHIDGKRLSSQHWHNFKAIAADIQKKDGYDNDSLLNLVEAINTHAAKQIVSLEWLFSYYRRAYELAFPEVSHRQCLVYAAIDMKNTLDRILNHIPDTEN